MPLIERLATEKDKDTDRDLSPTYTKKQIVQTAFDWYRERGFPYREIAPHVSLQYINQLSTMPTAELLHSTIGNWVADHYHRHRFHSSATNMRSPYNSYKEDKLLRIALKKHLKFFGKLPQGMFSTLNLVNGTQACANFRPGFALWMYRRFLPEGGTALDTSTGYGGRLVGFIASKGGLYIGIDPSTKTHKANLRMAEELMAADRVQLHNLPAEDLEHEEVEGQCDFAFTSPPYFAKEMYSDEETQSYIRYRTGKEWKRGFLFPMLALQFAALKPGSISAINIADVKLKGKIYPLVKWTKQGAECAGFEYLGTEFVVLSPNRWGRKSEAKDPLAEEEVEIVANGDGYSDPKGNSAREPVLLFRKPK
jgi:hypothetical protein